MEPNNFQISVTSGIIWLLNQCFVWQERIFLVKTVLNWGIRVKPVTMLIGTVLSGDPLYLVIIYLAFDCRTNRPDVSEIICSKGPIRRRKHCTRKNRFYFVPGTFWTMWKLDLLFGPGLCPKLLLEEAKEISPYKIGNFLPRFCGKQNCGLY